MRALLLVALLALGLPAGALASKQPFTPVVPPGNSGADQYVENVPTASGNGSTANIRHHQGAPGGILPASTQAALTRQGPVGVQAAAIAAATAPAGVGVVSKPHHKRSHSVAAGVSSSGPTGSPPAATVLRSVVGSGGGGVDAWLPAALAVTAAAIAVLALRRRRSMNAAGAGADTTSPPGPDGGPQTS